MSETTEIREYTQRRRFKSVEEFAEANGLAVLTTIQSQYWCYSILSGEGRILILKWNKKSFFIKSILAIDMDTVPEVANALANVKAMVIRQRAKALLEEAKKYPEVLKELKRMLK